MTLDELQLKIQNAKELDFGSTLESVIDLYKKIWLKGFLTILMIILLVIGVSLIFTLIGISPENYAFNEGFDFEKFVNLFSSNIIHSIPQTILISTITLALLAAFYRMCRQVDSGEQENDDYFYFLKKEYFTKVFTLGIIYAGIAIVAQLLYFIPYIYVYVPLAYVSIIFANNPDLSEMEIIKASFSLGNKKWFFTFGSLFVAGIMGMIGVIACGIGLFFTMSIAYLPVFFIYKEVVGFNENSELDRIEVHED